MPRDLAAARERLKTVFGYDDFRPGQGEIVAATLAGEAVLAVMPTGSGKSMCFQLPAVVENALTIVVSPLIALMRDQVQQMQAVGVSAAALNSQNTAAENARIFESLRAGALNLLYVAPERLLMEGCIDELRSARPRRLAIDEAHCVSEWGHDFRPEYRKLGRVASAFGAPVIALTATAGKTTRDDIVDRLFSAPPRVFLHSFDRPNLEMSFAAKKRPVRQLLQFLERREDESGIIYCASRRRTESLAAEFRAAGFDALPYHAGMDHAARMRNQDRFLREDRVVVCATIAFGMGVNKPDVRFVAHADMPSSIESYYQEIGRAGRDGLPAEAFTLYGLEDMAFRRRQIDEKGFPEERARIEHARFSAMALLCESPRCRRQTLLAYFDEASQPCGRCDHCAGKIKMRDGTIEAQKALSAAMRTGQRFGAGYLADLLIGEESAAVRRNGHAALKTFGVGKEHSRKTWMAIVRQLFAAGALKVASGEYGGFALTEHGRAILYGQEKFSLREDLVAAPPRRSAALASAPREEQVDGPLLAALKQTRREVAAREGVPVFMIFPDRTLIDMAAKRPKTLAELRDVYGVGERKLAAYGGVFFDALSKAE
jgi:ATP-dependent DNA helicase RecQ